MEFTEEAKVAIEDFIGKVIGRMSVSGTDRTEVEKELRSSYYEGAESRAKERADTKVTLSDVIRTLAAEGTPDQIATCYMKSYIGHIRRAGLLSRTTAYLIDIVVIVAGIWLFMIPLILLSLLAGDNITGWWVPAMIIAAAFSITAVISFVLCYNIVLEGHFGQTVGKYVMGLTVVKSDGTKIGDREAILRNIPKYVGNFIFIDALLMLVFFYKEKQRAFDKVAGTIVVHTR